MGNLMRMRTLVRIQVMVVAAIMVVVLAVLRFCTHAELVAAVGAVKQAWEDPWDHRERHAGAGICL